VFHRKNYFYPDMPKNYQISQYDCPVGTGGFLDVEMGDYVRRVKITRVHIEEDTGKLIHTGTSGRISESDSSIVDFNRAGTPLVEIVTEPDIRSAAEAKEYMINLRNLLLYLEVSDCNMEEGSLRCDANISVRAASANEFGTKTEIKNLNSFRFLQRGLEYETKRQAELLKSGQKVIQQTRHYDNLTDTTKALRTKEEAHDYRYFPDPDLVPVQLDRKTVEDIRASIPELPFEKLKRFVNSFGLPAYDARFLSSDKNTAAFFEQCMRLSKNAKALSNWIMGDFSALLNRDAVDISSSKISPAGMVKLIEIVDSGRVSLNIARSVFEEMFNTGTDPEKIIEKRGLEQISDLKVLESFVQKVLDENPGPVAQYQSGKEKALGFLIGRVMALSGGKANPKLVNVIIIEKLNNIYKSGL
ncbi:MAG: Asp-tRNA(Asn)/Glu-tRNA(Gln) amidotransferase subunit GatB, partial [Actinobacteria bacterium]|nr:Asp-tRNA(Asn)/Glu-tRNA(Gln) amidotransferase subunit GatB [Actinomycetota bacterium]